MKKKLFFTLSMTTFLAFTLCWFACQKDANTLPQTSVQALDAMDRGGGECSGQISLRVFYVGASGIEYQANPSFQDWHVKVEARACANQAWTTVLEFDDDAPNALNPDGTWADFSPILHDQFYRITVKNEDNINLPILIFSKIKNSSEPSNGFTNSFVYPIGQGETRIFDYFTFGGFWKGNCGYLWKYDCNLPGGE